MERGANVGQPVRPLLGDLRSCSSLVQYGLQKL
jgi:hypothetical protein